MANIWTPHGYVCRVCRRHYPAHQAERFYRHVAACVEHNADFIDSFRTPEVFEGDPELGLFARTEGDVYNRRPGTRKQPR